MRVQNALCETFREILQREEGLRRLSVTAEADELGLEAKDFVDFCIDRSPEITDVAERDWLHGSLGYWFAVAYRDQHMPKLRLKEPAEGYTFRMSRDLEPGGICVESLYQHSARPRPHQGFSPIRTFRFALTGLAYVGAVVFLVPARHLFTASLDSLSRAFTRPSQLSVTEGAFVFAGVCACYVALSLGVEAAVGRRHTRRLAIDSLGVLVILILLVFLVAERASSL